MFFVNKQNLKGNTHFWHVKIGINDWKQKLALNRRQMSDRVLGDWKLPQVFSASDVTCFRGSQGTEKCFLLTNLSREKRVGVYMFILNYTHKSTFVPKPPKTKIKSERKNNKKQQWLQPFWNTNSLAGDGYPFLLRPFFDLSWNVRGWVIFRWTFPALQV